MGLNKKAQLIFFMSIWQCAFWCQSAWCVAADSLFRSSSRCDENLTSIATGTRFNVAMFENKNADALLDVFQQKYVPQFQDFANLKSYEVSNLGQAERSGSNKLNLSCAHSAGACAAVFPDFQSPVIASSSVQMCATRLLQLDDSGYYYAELMAGEMAEGTTKASKFGHAFQKYAHSVKSPEPTTLALWGILSAIAIAIMRRRSKNSVKTSP